MALLKTSKNTIQKVLAKFSIVVFKQIVLQLIIGLNFQLASAQIINSLHYTDRDGLPSNEVYGIAIDKKGYLWAATDKGLSKFDGNKFENYTSLKGLKDNVFFNIQSFSSGRLWLWAYNMRFNYIENGEIKTYKYNHVLEKLITPKYVGITLAEGKEEKMFFYLNYKYFSISKEGAVEYYDKLIFGGEYIIAYKNGKVTNEGLKSLDLELLINEKWTSEAYPIELLFVNNVIYLYRDSEIKVLDQKGNVSNRKFDSQIESICVDNAGRLWVSFMNGNYLGIFNDLDSEPTIILKNSSGKLLKDEVGNIWFSNSYSGLYKFPNNFVVSYTVPTQNVIASLIPYKNNLILETYNSLAFNFDLKKKSINSMEPNELNTWKSNYFNEIDFGPTSKLNFYGNKLLNIFANNSNLIGRSFMKLPNEEYAYTGTAGLGVFDSKTNAIIQEIEAPGTTSKDIFVLSKSDIYIASITGLKYYNGRIITEVQLPSDLTGEHIQCLNAIDNCLIVGTKGKGIFLYSLKDKKVLSIYNQNISKNLPNGINCFYVSGKNLWVGTNVGIFLFEFQNNSLIYKNKININNGLAYNDVIILSIKNNHLYAITQNVLNEINLKNPDLFLNIRPSKPEILFVTAGQNRYEAMNKIETNYTQNDVEINFNAPFLFDKSRLYFKYKLDKYHTFWDSTQDTKIRFENLPPGSYIFRIYASFDNGKMASDERIITITILQPFYKKLWFLIVLGFVSLIIVFGIILLYLFNKNRNHKRNQELNEFKQKSIRAQLKPHFIFNTLNSIQNFVIKNKMEAATDFIEKFAKLTRYVLDSSDKEMMPISKELDILKNYMEIEQERFKNFEFSFDIDENIYINKYKIPSLLLQPIVENSIWHGFQGSNRNGLINISLSATNNDAIEITVTDNGKGRQKQNNGHNSKGLDLIHSRLNLLNSSKTKIEILDRLDSENNPLGTQVTITIPLIQ